MISTPTTCHQAEIEDSRLTRLTPKVLSAAWLRMITTKTRNTVCGVTSTPHTRLANAIQVVAQPKSMAAVTAISPRKLNQPTYQAHWRLFFLANRPAQKYRPPAVG